jgi:hypothetical protein
MTDAHEKTPALLRAREGANIRSAFVVTRQCRVVLFKVVVGKLLVRDFDARAGLVIPSHAACHGRLSSRAQERIGN